MIKKNLEISFTPPPPQKECFSILSFNIQGIGATFDELKIFIEEICEKYNFEFSAICLQECLIMCINDTFKEAHTKTLNSFSTWEGQVVKVNEGGLKNKIRHYQYISAPKNRIDNFREFTEEITPILALMEKDNSECIIACDYNIDLLKLNEKEVYGEFFDNLTENGFYLKITLSTRFSKKKHAILINNFYYK